MYLDDDLMTSHPELLWFGLCDSGEGISFRIPDRGVLLKIKAVQVSFK